MKIFYGLILVISFCISAFAQTQSVKIEPGWNLLSLPLATTDSVKSVLFPSAVSSAFIYQNGYLPKDTLNNGYGFWLKFDSAEALPIVGNVIYDDTIDVSASWNMLCSISTLVPVDSIKSEPSQIVISEYFRYIPGLGYQKVDTLQSGFGYWVKVNHNGTIILSAPSQEIIQYEPGDSTVFPSRIGQLSNTTIDSNSVILEYVGTTPQFEVGQYIVDTVGQGYCRKITAIQNNDSTVTISTTDALLTDAFKSLRIKKYIQLQPSSASDFRKTFIKDFDTTYTKQQNGQLYTIHLTSNRPRFLPNETTNATNFDFTYEWTNITIKVFLPDQKLAFSFTADTLLFAMNLGVDADIKIDWFTLKYLKFVPVVDNSTILKRSNVQFHAGISSTPELTLLELPGPPIVLGPVVFITTLFVNFGCDISAQLNIPWGADIVGSGDSHIEAGAEWSDGTFNPIVVNNQWITGEIKNNNADGTFSITSRPFLRAGVDFYTYGILGPAFYFKLGFPVTFSMPPISCSMKAELSTGVKLKFNSLLPIPIAFDLNRVLWDATIFSGCGTPINNPPLQPSNPTPADNATGQPTNVTLSWICSDPDGDPMTYDVYFGTDNPPTTEVGTDLTTPSLNISGLNYDQTYYWKVVAKDDHSNSTEGSVWSFTTGTAPSVPTLSTPIDGATDQSISPILSWHPSSSATSYTLQVSTDISFSSFVYDQNGLTDTSQQVNGLSNSTIYYWRVSATNGFGTSGWSSPVWDFTTALPTFTCGSTITYVGKTYNTVQIGSQCWLKENIDVGVIIQGNDTSRDNGIVEKYCYNNDPANCDIYGGLYLWPEAMQYTTTPWSRGICPPGWHIPTWTEFQTCSTTVNGDGNALKEIGQGTGNGAGTNISGYSLLLAGLHIGNEYASLGINANVWSSTRFGGTNIYRQYLDYDTDNIYFAPPPPPNPGFSVRCIRD